MVDVHPGHYLEMQDLLRERYDKIEKLEAEIERLRAALERIERGAPNNNLTWKAIRDIARAALRQKEG